MSLEHDISTPDRHEPNTGEGDPRALIEHLREENRRLREELERLAVYRQLAYRDALTDLYNRRYFDERFVQELRRAERTGTSVSVVLLDMDEFKRINDEAGHPVGDEVLRWVAGLLGSTARSIDVACRLGGDEFALILPETDFEGATKVLRRLTSALAAPEGAPALPQGLGLSFSLGAATFPDEGVEPLELVNAADARMFRHKRSRKNTRRDRVSFAA